MNSYSLFELNEYIRRVLALNFVEALWIRCEIGQMNESGGHLFMDLVQKAEKGDEIIARAEAVVWRSALRKLRRNPKLPLDQILIEGNEVLFKAQVDFHERYGYKLVIEEIDGDYTLGKILVKRTEVLQRLKKEGLLKKNASLELPTIIQRVAVISSANAAGLQDYLQQISSNPYGYDIRNTLLATTVQGDRAAKNIANQLQKLSSNHRFDTAIIIRGGGARLDLSAFDEYELGKAIANCPIPVITGVGHDVDETVADQVAHTDLKTPTAVADFIIHHNVTFESKLEQIALRMRETGQMILNQSSLDVRSLQQKISFQATRKWQESERNLELVRQSLRNQIRNYLQRKQSSIQEKEVTLQTFDVESVLSKGFALLTKKGKKVNSIELLKPSDHLNVILKDGMLDVVVNRIQDSNSNSN